jgi:hypothetical protein
MGPTGSYSGETRGAADRPRFFGGLSGRRPYLIVCVVSSDEGRRRGRAASREAGRVRDTATRVVDG